MHTQPSNAKIQQPRLIHINARPTADELVAAGLQREQRNPVDGPKMLAVAFVLAFLTCCGVIELYFRFAGRF